MGRLLNAALAPSTTQSYKNALHHYTLFHSTFYPTDPVLPVSVEKLAQFVAVCNSRGLKASTITSFTSAISYFHKIQGAESPSDSFLIKKILHGLRRSSTPDKRMPVTIPILQQVIKALSYQLLDQHTQTIFRAMILTAFFGLLRIGEIAVSKSSPYNVVLRQNVRFEFNENKPSIALLHLAHYKHSQGKVATIPLKRHPRKQLCPVRCLYQICSRAADTGPLFRHSCGCPVSTSSFRSVLRKCFLHCNLDPGRYTAHSLRIGGATYAHSKNVPGEEIKRMGRWKSSAYLKYIRPAPVPLPN